MAEKCRSLCVVSIQYAPEMTSNAAVVSGLAAALARRGHEVTVLAGTPHYRLPCVPPKYRFRPYVRETVEGVRVVRCWAYPASDGKFAKILNYLSFSFTAFFASLFVRRPDVVLVVSPPFWLALIALLLKTLRGSRVIYNAQDLFPEAYLASGEFRSAWIITLMDRLQRFVYCRSDRISVITPSFSKTIAAKGIQPQKILAIPNFVDVVSIGPRPKINPFSERWGLVKKFVVLYSGNIGYTHFSEILVDAAGRLAGLAEILLLVVGNGSKKKDLVKLGNARRLGNLKFLAPQPNEVLPDLLASADVLVLTTRKGVGKTSLPSRIYSFMGAGRPIVASIDADSDAAHLVLAARCGIVTEPENPQEFCQAIEGLYRDPARREAFGHNARIFIQHHYSQDAVVEQYERLLIELDRLRGDRSGLCASVAGRRMLSKD